MTDRLFVVELRGLPLAALGRAQDHNRTLVRELALVHTADQRGVAPARLLWLSNHLDQRYAAFNDAPRQRLQHAIEGDETHIEVRYEVPEHAAEAALELGEALDEVDQYCRTGDLLTLVTQPESLAFRRWMLGEFVAQIRDGADPTPWTESMASDDNGAMKTHGGPQPGAPPTDAATGTVVIDDDLDLEGAAEVRGDITSLLDAGVLHLVVDLAACPFIDSVGISLLLTTRERLQRSGGSVVVTNATDGVKRTLQTTGVYDILAKAT